MSNGQWSDLEKEMEKIPVPMDKLDLIISNTLREKETKKSKKKMIAFSLSAAVLGFGVFIGSASISPVVAKVASNIPIIGTFFNDSLDEGLVIAGKMGLTQMVNQSSKDSGITLTINEIFYDGTRLTFGFTQESLFAIGQLERPTIEVNGKEINFSSSFSGGFVTPQKYKGIMDITPTEELPEELDMKIRFDAVGLIPGEWKFNFPVKQSNEVTVIRPQEAKKIEGAEVKISSLKIGPAGTDLRVEVLKNEGNNNLDAHSLNFYVIDDYGNVLDTVTGNGSGETVNGKEITKLQFLYSPLKEGNRKVSVVPYTIPMSEKAWEEVSLSLNEQTLPFTIDQGDFGKVLVTKIVHQQEKTIVYFDLQSDAIVDNKLSRNSLWLEEANGKSLLLEDKPFAERIEGNKFKQEFASSKKKDVKIKTRKFPMPITYEGFKINIPN